MNKVADVLIIDREMIYIETRDSSFRKHMTESQAENDVL
jgi:hypothetical protein